MGKLDPVPQQLPRALGELRLEVVDPVVVDDDLVDVVVAGDLPVRVGKHPHRLPEDDGLSGGLQRLQVAEEVNELVRREDLIVASEEAGLALAEAELVVEVLGGPRGLPLRVALPLDLLGLHLAAAAEIDVCGDWHICRHNPDNLSRAALQQRVDWDAVDDAPIPEVECRRCNGFVRVGAPDAPVQALHPGVLQNSGAAGEEGAADRNSLGQGERALRRRQLDARGTSSAVCWRSPAEGEGFDEAAADDILGALLADEDVLEFRRVINRRRAFAVERNTCVIRRHLQTHHLGPVDLERLWHHDQTSYDQDLRPARRGSDERSAPDLGIVPLDLCYFLIAGGHERCRVDQVVPGGTDVRPRDLFDPELVRRVCLQARQGVQVLFYDVVDQVVCRPPADEGHVSLNDLVA
mmetsp:Transcript_2794/g.7094  ORF Transcript_2794/g.7094 Transcript_2794/m.7094 type:complete len:408 (-) Transcript_2794:979-2202(-)